MTQDEVSRKLGVIGAEIAKVTMWPSGSNLETFNFAFSQKNHSLVFIHNDPWSLKVTVDNFHLIDPEKWAEDDKHRRYPAVGRGGFGILWYMCDVSWLVKGQKGKADNVALGYPLDRDRALRGLVPGSPEHDVINDLLFRIEQIASGIFEADLLDKQPVNTERKFDEDRQSGRQWPDKF